MDNPKQTVALTLEEFEQQHTEFFADPVKKAAFYLGCMTEKLLEKQRDHYKIKVFQEPFWKNLNGLNVDTDELKKIFTKLLSKIGQYNDKLYNDELDYVQFLSKHISVNLTSNSDTSKTDISYAFATGMVMQKEFTKERIRKARLAKVTQPV